MQDAGVSEPNLELDERMAALEAEWRHVYEAGVEARGELERLQRCGGASVDLLRSAHSRLQRFEVLKARVMEKIERLEESVDAGQYVSGGDSCQR
jgi:hypothetical protein